MTRMTVMTLRMTPILPSDFRRCYDGSTETSCLAPVLGCDEWNDLTLVGGWVQELPLFVVCWGKPSAELQLESRI